MTAEDLLKQGDLDAALSALQESIRKSPQDARLRVFLFQLLCIQGDWTRAIMQLKTCATLDPAARTMAQMYREAIICEVHREKVFSGQHIPLIFGKPQDWIAWLVQAIKLQAQGDVSAAYDLRAKAFDAAPTISGTLNGTAFNWIADADPRLGPILEIIVDGKYFWVPFTAIHRIVIEPPADLRDAVWTPATITWSNGGDGIVLIPTRYVGSVQSRDPSYMLSRATGWSGDGDNVQAGLGQRMLVSDMQDFALLDIREMALGDAPVVADDLDIPVSHHG
ncbi:type VI secretion system accessory protein TagJ [Parasulfitobacter algicola]|uniref:Tetratricopeptide repeat protein n=1 Tax=Parasulfitobacter algicola TaxID=2614809 RepID=A0ABX2IUE8_9RHOB|nr:type VI secretion system accessory protein TagJ [Sulfitobacter algicola]NSX53678.1 tetratricopeptide repeat protein [Sulfitobacter algicola]